MRNHRSGDLFSAWLDAATNDADSAPRQATIRSDIEAVRVRVRAKGGY
jgi:hypothetical protein